MPRLLLLILFLSSSSAIVAQGIEFFHGTWEEAQELAKKEDKLIFIDAFATWCGPCKRMAREAFPKKEVGDVYNRYFINVKLDMERGDGLVFRTTYPVSAFPTLYFIGPDGSVVHRQVGAQGPEQLIRLAQFALAKVDNSDDYAARFDAGERDPELVLNYITALNKAGKPSLKVVNTYLDEQTDLDTPENLKIILEGTTEADSRVFDLLVEHRAAIEQQMGKAQIDNKIEMACSATLMKAVEFNVASLFEEAKAKMKLHVPDRSRDFALDADMQFYSGAANLPAYLDACSAYGKAKVKEDPMAVNSLASKLLQQYSGDEQALKIAADLARKAGKETSTYEPWLTLAQIQHKQGKSKDARKSALKARERAAGDDRILQYIDALIQEF
ncbi:MAG: thioredoxin family protein [Saprospiraceae bacterium]